MLLRASGRTRALLGVCDLKAHVVLLQRRQGYGALLLLRAHHLRDIVTVNGEAKGARSITSAMT